MAGMVARNSHVKASDVLARSAVQAPGWGSLLRAGAGSGSLHVIFRYHVPFERHFRICSMVGDSVRNVWQMPGRCREASACHLRVRKRRCTCGDACCEMRMEAVC